MDSSCEKKKNWVPNKYSLICSDHFEPTCFIIRLGKVGCILYDNSVTTIFPSFPAYYQTEQRKRKLPMKMVYVSPHKSCEPSSSKVAKLVGREHSYASTKDSAHSEVKQLKNTKKIFKQKVWQQKKKKWKHGRTYEKPKRQLGFKSTTQPLRPQFWWFFKVFDWKPIGKFSVQRQPLILLQSGEKNNLLWLC